MAESERDTLLTGGLIGWVEGLAGHLIATVETSERQPPESGAVDPDWRVESEDQTAPGGSKAPTA